MRNLRRKASELSLSARLKAAYIRLAGLNRADYKTVWNRISTTSDLAMIGVAGTADEESFFASGESSAESLKEMLAIGTDDAVLEIGCGVGRIGKFLAQYCREWTGADISGEMVAKAKSILRDQDNTNVVELGSSDL